MLDDIAVGPFLEQPAGEVAPPFIVGGAAHVELNEGAGFLHIFPGGGRLAGLEADDRIAYAQRVAGLHREVGGDAVTLVEQADHRNAFGHGRTGQSRRIAVANLLPRDLHRAGLVGSGKFIAATGRKRQHQGEGQDRRDHPRRTQGHDASGLHAS